MPIFLFLSETEGGLHLSAGINTQFAQIVFLVGSWKVTSTFAIDINAAYV